MQRLSHTPVSPPLPVPGGGIPLPPPRAGTACLYVLLRKFTLQGGVLDLDASILYPHSEFVAVDTQADDDVGHLNRFWVAFQIWM
jgi:hypothetical protein